MSVRLLIVVEGYSEEGFVKHVLAPHLYDFNVYADAKLITTRYRHGQKLGKGGGRSYKIWKDDFDRLRKQDENPDRWFTSMIDLYGMANFKDEFPGYWQSRAIADPYQRVAAMEQAFADAIGDRQFVPYVQLHEFEAPLLADPQKLELEYIEHVQQIERLVLLAASSDSPELIDEGPDTAPSKRIIREIPEYGDNKARVGPLITENIGIATLRQKCPHFDEWVSRLESLSASASSADTPPPQEAS